MNLWRVLIIDDSPAMRLFIRRVINLSGFPVERFDECSNGEEALRHLQGNKPDIILCDINMPIMNGEQFLEALSQKPASERPPVIIVSTDSTHTRVDRMLELGARSYIRKPFTPEAMREILDTVSEELEKTAQVSGV